MNEQASVKVMEGDQSKRVECPIPGDISRQPEREKEEKERFNH